MLHCKARLQVAIVLLLLYLQPVTSHASPLRLNALHSIYDFVSLGGGSLGLTVLRVFRIPLALTPCLGNTMQ